MSGVIFLGHNNSTTSLKNLNSQKKMGISSIPSSSSLSRAAGGGGSPGGPNSTRRILQCLAAGVIFSALALVHLEIMVVKLDTKKANDILEQLENPNYDWHRMNPWEVMQAGSSAASSSSGSSKGAKGKSGSLNPWDSLPDWFTNLFSRGSNSLDEEDEENDGMEYEEGEEVTLFGNTYRLRRPKGQPAAIEEEELGNNEQEEEEVSGDAMEFSVSEDEELVVKDEDASEDEELVRAKRSRDEEIVSDDEPELVKKEDLPSEKKMMMKEMSSSSNLRGNNMQKMDDQAQKVMTSEKKSSSPKQSEVTNKTTQKQLPQKPVEKKFSSSNTKGGVNASISKTTSEKAAKAAVEDKRSIEDISKRITELTQERKTLVNKKKSTTEVDNVLLRLTNKRTEMEKAVEAKDTRSYLDFCNRIRELIAERSDLAKKNMGVDLVDRVITKLEGKRNTRSLSKENAQGLKDIVGELFKEREDRIKAKMLLDGVNEEIRRLRKAQGKPYLG